MPDNVAIPRHMQVFREVWAELAEHLSRDIFAPIPRVADRDVSGIPAHSIARVSREVDMLRSWQTRVVTWFHGPMAVAFADPDIDDQAMRRVAGRLSCFAEDLVDCRRGLRSLAHEPALRAVASRLDAVCFELQKQLKRFVSGVVKGLDPEVLWQRREMGGDDGIDDSFTLRIEMDETLAEVDAWIERAWGVPVRPVPEPTVQEQEFVPAAPRNPDRITHVITGLLVVAFLIALIAFGYAYILVVLVVVIALLAIIEFAFREPLMALIALLIFGS